MIKFKIVTFLIVVGHFQILCANNKVGNGGDVVSCKHDKQPQILDFYESEQELNLGTKEVSPFEVAKDRILQLQKIAPKLYTQYLSRLQSIQDEIEFKDGVRLTDIKDSEHLFLPEDKSCEILQVAIRKKVIGGAEKRFLFDKKIWDTLGTVGQAGLLTHEIIYEHLSKLGETDSVKARKVNRFLYAKITDKAAFWKLIADLEVPIYP